MSDKLQFVAGSVGGYCAENDKLKFVGHHSKADARHSYFALEVL